jgi:large subunit ribosomal protein L3
MSVEGLLGKKLGMVQMFDKNGTVVGCTVLEAGPCLVTQVRTKERDGYEAVQLGFGTKKRLNEPEKGHLKNLGNFRYLREFKADSLDGVEVGQRFGAELFKPGDRVDVTGVSKGRGFAGVVKRHGFGGGPKTHGQSDRHRAPGSIGSGTTPGRVMKGLRMAGHMGDQRTTTRNLEVMESNPARGIILVRGPVPGARDGLVRIRRTKTATKKK